MKAFFKCLVIAVILCNTGFINAQDKKAAIDSLIVRANRLDVFNGNILVVEDGKEMYRNAIGYADASRQKRLTDKYRFQIGSIAKEFNAVAIMMLSEQGRLKLEDKISVYLTGLPEWSKTVSIKNLLQYTSGVPNIDWKSVKNDAEVMAAIKNFAKLDFEPGANYGYNNSNTILQRQIVEKITGMSFKDFVTGKMLKPLKMKSSVVDPGEDTPLMAKSFSNEYVQSPLAASMSGWTAVTLDDFYRWEQSLEKFELINPSSTKEILIPAMLNKQSGLGGGTIENNTIVTHNHDGTNNNFQALLTANAIQRRTIILMTNNRQNNLYDINGAIQNILDGKPYHELKKSLVTALKDKMDTGGTQLLNAYKKLKATHPNDYDFYNEAALNGIGYELLGNNRNEDAIIILEHNAKLFPKSGNVYDSLGEAYYNNGNKEKALLNYRKAFELDPANTGAKEKIIELQ